MGNLPEGTVTFLFSDVEGSTRLAKSLGDARWASLLEDHRSLLRRAFAAHGGHEVDTQGDAFFVVFTRPTDAVAAALDVQRGVEAHSWPEGGRLRVRLGLHTGEAVVRGGHYIGQEVHRASRICDSGHGGQIVVSQTTANLVGEGLPTETTLAELGRYTLKDLDEPQRLFQLSAEGLGSTFPRLRTLDAPNNLPAERSSFIGREKETETIQRLLAEHRLVTLTGIGGSGKTRLALRVGANNLIAFPDGVFFIDLAPITDDGLVAQTTASACGLSLDSEGGVRDSLADQLVAALTRRKCLLLVDNCEHLLDTIAELVDRLLYESSSVVVLATSREALGVEGEQVVRVASLGIAEDPSEAAPSESVQLFVERATAVKPGFQLDSQTHPRVVEICRRLDGIPLAIEFAAARIAHLSPQQIAERLEDMFRLLTGGRRRIQRQQTLAATLDWSHDLLDDSEKILFRRLAVFAGSAGLDAIEGVCSGDDLPVDSVLDLLASLVAKSLVVAVDDNPGDARYRLLETVRLYASDKLTAAGEAETVRSRHRDWYLEWLEGEPFEHLCFTPAGVRVLLREGDNFRAAADWCERDEHPDQLARLATRMYGVSTDTHSALSDRRQRLLAALRQADRLSTDQRLACHAVLGSTAWSALETEVPIAEANRAIDLANDAPNPFLVLAFMTRSFAHSVLAAGALLLGAEGEAEVESVGCARRDTDAAVAAATELPAEWRAYAEFNAWMIETNMGLDMRGAAAWAAACLQTGKTTSPTSWLRRMPFLALAVSHHLLQENDKALRASLAFRALPEEADMPAVVRSMSIEIAPALAAAGEDRIALQVLADAVPLVRRLGTPLGENHLLSMFAYVEHLLGRSDRAGRLLGAARYLGGAVDLPIPFRTPASWSLYRHYLPLVRAALGPDEGRRARDEGRAMTLDTAFAYALERP